MMAAPPMMLNSTFWLINPWLISSLSCSLLLMDQWMHHIFELVLHMLRKSCPNFSSVWCQIRKRIIQKEKLQHNRHWTLHQRWHRLVPLSDCHRRITREESVASLMSWQSIYKKTSPVMATYKETWSIILLGSKAAYWITSATLVNKRNRQIHSEPADINVGEGNERSKKYHELKKKVTKENQHLTSPFAFRFLLRIIYPDWNSVKHIFKR